jgi:ribose 5-phosphate isomerase B
MALIRIGIAADHGGFELKEYLKVELFKEGYEVVDFGNNLLDPDDDYPDFVVPMARSVVKDELYRGIAVCGSGVGACVAVNKLRGIRACLISDTFSAHQGVEDDNMNVICLGGRVTGHALALDIVNTFLHARFTGAERHKRRLGKVAGLE